MEQKKKSLNKGKQAGRNPVPRGLFFNKLLQNVDAPVMVTDSRGRVVFANKRYLDFFRFSEKDIIGKPWIGMVIPEFKRRPVLEIFKGMKEKKALGRIGAPASVAGIPQKYVSWIGIPLKEKRTFLYMFIGRERKRPAGGRVRGFVYASGRFNAAHREVIEALFNASMASEPGTAKHAYRVMSFTVPLAEKLRFSKKKIEILKAACLLHDLGKLAVDKRILFKKGKLKKDEFDQFKKHPHWGSEAVDLIYFLRDIIPIMAHHHENYDGSGYPGGVKGDAIPLEARMLSVVDIYEALTADRPYRKGFSVKKAIGIMEEEKGHKLDPKITDAFLDMVRKGEVG